MTTNTLVNAETEQGINWKLAQVIALAAPALGYTLAFTHEVAYCSVFKIPNEFISLSWNVIIVSIVASLGGAYLAMFPFIMLSMTKYSKKPIGPIERRLYFLFVIFIVLFGVAYRYLIVTETVYLIGYLVLMVVMLFLFPLFDTSVRMIKGYRNKLAAYDDSARKWELPFSKWLNLRTIIIVLLLLGAYGGAYLDGRAQAFNQEEFLVPSTYPNSVVLRIYGDELICAPVNPITKEVEMIYFVLRTNDPSKPLLSLTRTGRLHLVNYIKVWK